MKNAILISEQDAGRLGLSGGDKVKVTQTISPGNAVYCDTNSKLVKRRKDA